MTPDNKNLLNQFKDAGNELRQEMFALAGQKRPLSDAELDRFKAVVDWFNSDVVKIACAKTRLAEFGFGVNVREERSLDSRTALKLSLEAGQKRARDYLLQCGADQGARDAEDGSTALHIAVQERSIELVDILLSQGHDPFAKDHKGNTPLFYAAVDTKCKNAVVVERMLRQGADANVTEGNGKTVREMVRNIAQSSAKTKEDMDIFDRVKSWVAYTPLAEALALRPHKKSLAPAVAASSVPFTPGIG